MRLSYDAVKRFLELWPRDFQIATDFRTQLIVNLAMTRDAAGLLGRSVHVDGMITALSQQLTTVLLQMTDEIAPLHSPDG
jgi:hypothetical protein